MFKKILNVCKINISKIGKKDGTDSDLKFVKSLCDYLTFSRKPCAIYVGRSYFRKIGLKSKSVTLTQDKVFMITFQIKIHRKQSFTKSFWRGREGSVNC